MFNGGGLTGLTEEEIPREIVRPCSHCDKPRLVLNGAYYQDMRKKAGLTLVFMSGPCKCSVNLLSLIERGESPFLAKYAKVYDEVCSRYMGAKDES